MREIFYRSVDFSVSPSLSNDEIKLQLSIRIAITLSQLLMKKLLLLLLFAFFQLAAFSQTNTQDTNFGENGTVELNLGYKRTSSLGESIAVQTDGKILAGGHTENNSSDMMIVRLNSDETFDSTFDDDGRVSIDAGEGADDYITDIQIQKDDRILVLGEKVTLLGKEIVILRLNANGSLDITFGTHGKIIISTDNDYTRGYALAIQKDNKILVAGETGGSTTDFFAARLNMDGTLDSSFDTDGKLVVALSPSRDGISGIAIQDDNKIIFAGYSFNSQFGEFAAIRVLPEGSLDGSFGTGGIVKFSIGPEADIARSVLLQTDGKILLAGYSVKGSENYYTVVRLNMDGSFDSNFDNDGVSMILEPAYNYAEKALLQEDGKILIVGTITENMTNKMSIGRFNSNGSVDMGFDGDGISVIDFGNRSSGTYAAMTNGKILAIGAVKKSTGFDFAIAKLNPDGSLDSSFNSDGKMAVAATSETGDRAFNIALQKDGKLLVVGSIDYGTDVDFAVVRLEKDGLIDKSFGDQGIKIIDFAGFVDRAGGLAVQEDGKILVGGIANNGTDYDFAVLRLNSDGSTDTNFGVKGKLMIPIGGGDDVARTIDLQQDGRIVMSGWYEDENSNQKLVVIRLKEDGTIDHTFNGGGKISMPFDSGEKGLGYLAIQDDGKILITGYSYNSLTATDMVIARINQDGTLDASFNEDGINSVHFTEYDEASGIVVQKDGKIIITGTTINSVSRNFAAARFNVDGSLDTTFAVEGKLIGPEGEASTALIQEDGSVVVGGDIVEPLTYKVNYAFFKFDSTGSPDETFGSSGYLVSHQPTDQTLNKIVLKPDNYILSAGWEVTRGNFLIKRIINTSKPSISLEDIVKTYGDVPFALNATSPSQGKITFTLLSGNSISLNGAANATISKAGTTIVVATQEGWGGYLANTDTAIVEVKKAPLMVKADSISSSYGSEISLKVSYHSFIPGENETHISPPSISTEATSKSSVGNYPIIVGGGFSENYSFTYLYGNLAITKATQTITFPAIPDLSLNAPSYKLRASSSSGLPLAYSISGPANVSDSLRITGTGPVVITARQEGNSNYFAAMPLSQTFCAIPLKPIITVSDGVLISSSLRGNQWLLNGEEIPGADSSVFLFSENGNYSVRVTFDGCSNESEATGFITGDELLVSETVKLFPNPAFTKLKVEYLGISNGKTTASLSNLNGKTLRLIDLSKINGKFMAEISIESLPSGFYFLIVETESRKFIKRIIKR